MCYMCNISKNLLSLSKLTTDNNILVEFDTNYCFSKVKLTWKKILKGIFKNDLYQLPLIERDTCAYVSIKVS